MAACRGSTTVTLPAAAAIRGCPITRVRAPAPEAVPKASGESDGR